MRQPQGYVNSQFPNHVCLLHKALYVLKQAPRAWFEGFTTHLYHIGFLALGANGNLFIYRYDSHLGFLLLYVDDIILTGNDKAFKASIIQLLSFAFDHKDLGLLHYFLGLQIEYTTSGLFVHQTKYATNLLTKFAMADYKPCKTPCSPNQHFLPNDSPPLFDPSSYRSLVGALQYITFTKLDLSFAVQQACQYMCSPTQNHLQASKHILGYLTGTLHYGIAFTPSFPSLSTYCDADWAGDPIDRRSISGIVVFFGNFPITWSAKKQSTISRSSTEAKYRVLASIAVELYWVRMLLRDLGIFLSTPSLMWCDNVNALAIASNPVFHAHAKHIEVDYHFVCEKVLRKNLMVKFISSNDQLANIFTKGLPSSRFHWLMSKLMWKFPFRLRVDESSGNSSCKIEEIEDEASSVSSVNKVQCKTNQNNVVPSVEYCYKQNGVVQSYVYL